MKSPGCVGVTSNENAAAPVGAVTRGGTLRHFTPTGVTSLTAVFCETPRTTTCTKVLRLTTSDDSSACVPTTTCEETVSSSFSVAGTPANVMPEIAYLPRRSAVTVYVNWVSGMPVARSTSVRGSPLG